MEGYCSLWYPEFLALHVTQLILNYVIVLQYVKLYIFYVMADNQNPNGVSVQRYFEYKDDSIHMYSRFETEYGHAILHGYVSFIPSDPRKDEDGRVFLSIHQDIDDKFDQDVPLEMRVGEMNYLLSISLLFNPKNKTDYGIPKDSQTSEL